MQHLKIIGICYYANVLKEKKKHTNATHKTLMKTHIVQQTKLQLRHYISRHVSFSNTRKYMGPLNDEIMLQVEEKNKNN